MQVPAEKELVEYVQIPIAAEQLQYAQAFLYEIQHLFARTLLCMPAQMKELLRLPRRFLSHPV